MKDNLQPMAKDVLDLLHSVHDDSPDNVVRVFFSEKRASEKYRTFMPQASNNLQKKILALILPPLFKALELPVIQYNPVGVLDEENELISPMQVSSIDSFKESLTSDHLITEMNLIKIPTIWCRGRLQEYYDCQTNAVPIVAGFSAIMLQTI